MHHGGCHLGRRHEGGGGHIEQDFRLRAPAGEHGQPAIGLGTGGGDDALRHLALDMRVREENQGGHGSAESQPTSSNVPTL